MDPLPGAPWLVLDSEADKERERRAGVSQRRDEASTVLARLPRGSACSRTKAQLTAAYEAFHQMHEAMYGYRIPGAVIELISFKVTAIGAIPKPQLGRVQAVTQEPPRTRQVYFAGHGFVPCRIIRRTALPVGERLAGPLIVEEEGSTTLVEPGMVLARNVYDILRLEVG